MYQIDEKLMADNRALIAINPTKEAIDRTLKNGMLNYVVNENNDLFLSIPRSLNYGEFNRVIQETPDGKIPNDLTFKGNIVIEKNLFVMGNTTSIDTPNLTIEDNIIELNKNETGNGISLVSAGIQVNRGQKGNANWLFTEATDVANTGAFIFDVNGAVKAWVYADGNFKALGNVDAQKVNAHGDITGDTKLTITGASLLKSTLTVNGATSLTSTLGVTGATTLSSSLTTVGATILNNTLRVDGATTLKAALTAEQAATFQTTLGVTGATTLSSTLNVTGVTTLSSTLGVTGAATFNNTARVIGAATMDSTLNVKGNTDLDGTLNVDGKGTFQVAVDIKGRLDAADMYLAGTKVTVEGHHQPAASVDYSNTGFPTLTDLKKVADEALYFPIAINSFTNNVNLVEVGQTVASVTLNWVLNKTDIQMQQQSLDQAIGNIAPLNVRTYAMPSANLRYTAAATHTWTLNVWDEKINVNTTTSINWQFKRYWGTSASAVTDSTAIKALAASTTGGGELSTVRTQSRTFDCTGGKYFYFAYPTAWGSPTSLGIGGIYNTDFTVSVVSFTNDYAVTVNYNVVKINNLQNGSSIAVTVN